MRQRGLNVGPGSFAENLTTQGLDLLSLPIGSRVRVGEEVVLEITQHQDLPRSLCHLRDSRRLRHAPRGHLRLPVLPPHREAIHRFLEVSL